MKNFNIEDYITDEEKREIARQVFKDYCTKIAEDKTERVFSNEAYRVIGQMIDDEIDGDVSAIIRDKAINLIDDLCLYTVFKRPDYWNGSSKAYDVMQHAIKANEQRVIEKVASLVDDLDDSSVTEMLKDCACELLDEKLFGQGKEQP